MAFLDQVHEQEGQVVHHVDAGEPVVELDAVEQDRTVFEEDDVGEMQVAVAVADPAGEASPFKEHRGRFQQLRRCLIQRRDILRVARDLASEVKAGRLSAEGISPALIQKRLLTAALPGVDLIVYTGQSHRLADALTFESAYAEFAFTDCLWPDFTPSDLQGALADFGYRERRYGKTSAQVQSPTPS